LVMFNSALQPFQRLTADRCSQFFIRSTPQPSTHLFQTNRPGLSPGRIQTHTITCPTNLISLS